MILIFDYFETLLNSRSIDFNRGLKVFWENNYRDKCPFEDMKAYGEELFQVLLSKHAEGIEFPFVKEELPLYADKFGGEKISMSVEEEADFLMLCNDFEPDPGIEDFVKVCSEKNIPMYVLSNSGYRGEALMEILNRFGMGKFFNSHWSSADYGKIKPCKEFFELAVRKALEDNPSERREDIVFIGDIYETDVVGAYNAGIKSAWLNKKNEIDNRGLATYICSYPHQLSVIIR